MHFLNDNPDKDTLISNIQQIDKNLFYEVNGHIHTTYSFSAFKDIPQIFRLAKEQNVHVLGINDFYTTAGYEEFCRQSVKNKIFPLFNIEFMGLIENFCKKNIRVNDPNNPGRIYFSGKGLDYPVNLKPENKKVLENLKAESLRQITEMAEKVNYMLRSVNALFKLNIKEIIGDHTKGILRERHIAEALRLKIKEYYPGQETRLRFLKNLYGGKKSNADINNIPAIENEIRTNLLKAGGSAFVPEDPEVFLSLEGIIDFIIEAGGIPCYPVLLDDKNGLYTDFEKDAENMHEYLRSKKIYCLELIPNRNSFNVLKYFVKFFHKKGFVISFGTEHNTSEMLPLKVSCRDKAIDGYLRNINSESACIIAAHQYLRAKKEKGFIDEKGMPRLKDKEYFKLLGKAVIYFGFAQYK